MDRIDVAVIGVALMDLPLGPLDEHIFQQETVVVPEIKLTTGGDALNEAVILSRLGKKTALISRIGTDMLGDLIIERCKAEGVDHSRLERDPETDTRINVVVIGKDGQRHFVKNMGPGSGSLEPADIDYGFVAKAKAVSLASIFSSRLRNPETVLNILKEARAHGVATFADMVPMTGGETMEDLREAMPYLDYFLPNREEASLLTGLSDPDEMADCLLTYGIGTVVIKLGSEGCLVKSRKERHRIPAFSVDAVDTTGAGDNFAAGFITAVLDGGELLECGLFASAVAALSTEAVGATKAVMNKDQVMEFLLKNKTEQAYRLMEKDKIAPR